MYMQRTTSDAAGNGLYTTIKYMRGAAGIGLGTTIKHLQRTTSGAAGNGLGAAMKYLRRTTSAAANNGLSTTITPPCSTASFEVNSEPHTGHVPRSVCVWGPSLLAVFIVIDFVESQFALTSYPGARNAMCLVSTGSSRLVYTGVSYLVD
jgi:hypothetical protein